MDHFKVTTLLLLACFTWVTINGQCSEPSNARRIIGRVLYRLYTQNYFGNFTFFKVPDVRDAIEDHPQFRCHNDVGSGNRYYCNNLSTSSNSFDLLPNVDQTVSVNLGDFERTDCRWQYKVTYDENRIPNYITEAACQCDKCRRGRCRKVYSYIPIVVKTCDVIRGQYVYTGVIRETPVACMCVHNQQRRDSPRYVAAMV